MVQIYLIITSIYFYFLIHEFQNSIFLFDNILTIYINKETS